MLRAFGYPVAKCCDMFGVVGLDFKMVKFFMQYLWMLQDVAVVWPGSCNNVALGHAHYISSIFNSQHQCRNMLQQVGQMRATCQLPSTMLRSVAFKCYDRLAGACKCWANNVEIC